MRKTILKPIIGLTAAAILVGAYGYHFPNIVAYRCSGEVKVEIIKTTDGSKEKSSFFTDKEYGEIKEYWRGLKYTLANYEMDECSDDGLVIFCSTEDANGKRRFKSFDIYKSLYSYSWTYTSKENETKYFSNDMDCRRVASIFEK